MAISGLNHAVLYVRDADKHRQFYEELLGFRTVSYGSGKYAFMAAPGSSNHHDIAFFSIGAGAGPSAAGSSTVGLYHLAWQVQTLPELVEMEAKLRDAGVLVGASDHGASKSLYCKDPDGLEFEVMWLVPSEEWEEAHNTMIAPLDLAAELAKYGS